MPNLKESVLAALGLNEGEDGRAGTAPETDAPAGDAASAEEISAAVAAAADTATAAEQQRWATVLVTPEAEGNFALAVASLAEKPVLASATIIRLLKAAGPAAPAKAADTPQIAVMKDRLETKSTNPVTGPAAAGGDKESDGVDREAIRAKSLKSANRGFQQHQARN